MSQPVGVRNDHSGEQSDHTCGENREDTNNRSRDLQVLQFRRFDFTIDLSQGFEPTHRKKRMPKRDNQCNSGHA